MLSVPRGFLRGAVKPFADNHTCQQAMVNADQEKRADGTRLTLPRGLLFNNRPPRQDGAVVLWKRFKSYLDGREETK